MLEDQVSCLKKDMAKMKEDTDQDILLLKRDNARMKVELEQNREELETLQALVEAIWEQQFPTAPALCDPSVPPPQSGLGHTIPSVPTSAHPSPPPALSYRGPVSPSIQALLAPHPPSPSPISPIRGLDADEASSLVPVVVSPGPMDIINIPADTTNKPDDTPVMDHSLTPAISGHIYYPLAHAEECQRNLEILEWPYLHDNKVILVERFRARTAQLKLEHLAAIHHCVLYDLYFKFPLIPPIPNYSTVDWEGAVQQLIQNQQNFRKAFAQFLTHQANVTPAAAGAIPAKKIVTSPEAYDGSPQKFHKWWSKVKVWIATTHATASDQQKAVAVYSHLEGPHAGRFAQVCLDECMAAKVWPTWAALQMEIESFFLPGNNKEWARSQLLHLRQGPRQRIDNFLAQFQALKLQSECPDEYAKDLLERVVSCKILEQVYMQGLDRTTWLTPLGSSAPMDIGATNTHPQCGKGIQCYNCQGFGHISHECSQPRRAQQQGPQQGWAVQPQVDPNNDDERVKAVRGMSFAEMRDYFKHLKD
ncbi:hypothetical protein SCLCIDRAFT_27997 [Scleroderma citrinum Foug A]|uniref:CCHC-type domain-containing protein n=1 Tax=Scleroderma citrinum Foug A TaxID=1036808 RepID=A0A0C2Z9S0_9AGAM|nr:hypothetical protein SCLCIDRAFT_27997 [Scleroderma citrinum Foug A]